ncbi:tape measure protein [Rufibacter glacialis]|uniref:tape measure protein n=1 Tax=Rufibacter glacialis TaxID=1259555 RepID=UPI001CEC43FA|nr:tape measure protein [Rufibacter glacialis]
MQNLGSVAEKAAGRYVDSAGKLREANGRFVSSATLAAEAAGKTGSAVSKSATNFQSLGNSMKSAGEGMTKYITAPLLLMGGASIKAFGDLQALEKGFIATYKGAGDVNEELRKTQEVAKLPGLGLKEALQGVANLQAVKFSAEQARGTMMAYGNALATVGKGKADLEGVITALSQMATKGKVSAEEINQIAERVPQIRQAMVDVFGTADTEVLQKMGISVEEFVAKTTAELNKLPKVTGGVNNALENFADGGIKALSKVGDALNKSFNVEGKLNAMGDALNAAAEDFGNLDPAVQKTIFVVAGLAAAAGPLLLALGAIAAAAPTVVAGFGLITTGAAALKVALLGTAGTVGVIVAAVAAVGVVGYKIAKSMEVSSEKATKATQAYKEQKTALNNLTTSINPLLARYEELKGKSVLTKEEQGELKTIIEKVTNTLPGAITQFDKYGKAMDINVGKARELVAAQKALADSTKNDALKEQAKQLHINAGAIQEVTNLLKTGGRYQSNNYGQTTKVDLTKEEKAANAARLKALQEQRKALVGLYRELKGLPPLYAAITPPPTDTKGQTTVNSLLAIQNQLLQKQKDIIAGATDEKTLATANARAAAIQVEIDRLESLGVANTKMRDALNELNKELFLNGQYSLALGDTYSYVEGRRSVLESGIKSLINAGFSPGSAMVQRFKAELDSLPEVIDRLSPSLANTDPFWKTYIENLRETGSLMGTLKSQHETFRAEIEAMGQQMVKAPVIPPPQVDVEGWEAVKQQLIDQGGSMSDALTGVLSSGVTLFADTLGNAFSGGFGNMASVFESFKQGLKNIAKEFGMFMVKWGVAQTILANPLGPAAIVAGVALTAFAGSGGSKSSGGATGGTGTVPTYKSPASNNTYTRPGAAQTQEVIFKIEGRELVGVLRKEAYNAMRTG